MKEKYSVALCTYNGEQYIQEQLLSIINQTVKVDEIVICGDLSSQKLRSLRIHLLEEALERYNIQNGYTEKCRKCTIFYNRLQKTKGRSMAGLWFLIKSLLTGMYIYRFCDRGA